MRPKTWANVPEILSIKEVSDLLMLNRNTVERKCREGIIKATRTNGKTGKYIISKCELMRFVGAAQKTS